MKETCCCCCKLKTGVICIFSLDCIRCFTYVINLIVAAALKNSITVNNQKIQTAINNSGETQWTTDQILNACNAAVDLTLVTPII